MLAEPVHTGDDGLLDKSSTELTADDSVTLISLPATGAATGKIASAEIPGTCTDDVAESAETTADISVHKDCDEYEEVWVKVKAS